MPIAAESQIKSDYFDRLIANIVSEGDDERLRKILDGASEKKLKHWLTSKCFDNSTILVFASRIGKSEIVKLLLEKGADAEETGTVTFDGEQISSVPPLWAAAAAGHFDVCKVLVNQKANVNQTTSTKSTPLRVKFLVEHGADIEIPNRHGHTPLMLSAYREQAAVVRFLLSIGARVDRSSVKGNTVLHDAAESGNVQIMKLLLDYGAQIKADDYGVTPLISAAMSGHVEMLELLFPYSKSHVERHNALKLIGAVFVDKHQDFAGALKFWKDSFNFDVIGSRDLVDSCYTNSLFFDFIDDYISDSRVFYANYTETKSLEHVNALNGDPDAIRMQALLIRERILGQSHSDTHYYIRYRGAFYLDIRNWDRTWSLWSYVLQLEQFYLQPLSMAVTNTLCAFLEAFLLLSDERSQLYHGQNIAPQCFPSVKQIAIVLDRAIYEAERYLNPEENCKDESFWLSDEPNIKQELSNLFCIIIHLIHLICKSIDNPASKILDKSLLGELHSSHDISIEVNFLKMCKCAFFESISQFQSRPKYQEHLNPFCLHLKCILYRLIKVFELINPVHSVLHMALTEKQTNNELPRLISFCVVEKLLQTGANVKCVDEFDNTPLHILLNNKDVKDNKARIAKLLLSWGAPLFARNIYNETCFDLIRNHAVISQYVKPVQYLSLKQVAANAVMRNLSGVATFNGILPKSLESYISLF